MAAGIALPTTIVAGCIWTEDGYPVPSMAIIPGSGMNIEDISASTIMTSTGTGITATRKDIPEEAAMSRDIPEATATRKDPLTAVAISRCSQGAASTSKYSLEAAGRRDIAGEASRKAIPEAEPKHMDRVMARITADRNTILLKWYAGKSSSKVDGKAQAKSKEQKRAVT